jgi:amino acid transporter
MPDDPTPTAEGALVRAMGVRALAANAVNLIVGASIFVLPAVVAADLGAAAVVVYLVCAAAVGLVALCFAEAGSRVALTGGTYAYVDAAFGPFVGFLAGVLFWFGSQVIASAAVAVVLVGSIGELLPAADGPASRAILVVALYATLTAVNVRGVRAGTRLVEILTVAKLAPLLVLVLVGILAGRAENLAWDRAPSLDDVGRTSLVLVFAFMGAEGALTPSGEVKDPARTVPRAVLLALAVVAALYVAVQLAAQAVLGPTLAASQVAPLAAAAERALGPTGRVLMLGGAAVSTFGYVSGDMLASPRALFAFARDGFLPARLAAVHERYRTPHLAIVAHALVACAFALTGSFRALAVLSVVSTLLVYLACCLAALVLRRRDVRAGGTPFRVPGGPAVPVLACAVVLWLLSNAERAELLAVAGVAAVAALLYGLRRSRRRALAATAR